MLKFRCSQIEIYISLELKCFSKNLTQLKETYLGGTWGHSCHWQNEPGKDKYASYDVHKKRIVFPVENEMSWCKISRWIVTCWMKRNKKLYKYNNHILKITWILQHFIFNIAFAYVHLKLPEKVKNIFGIILLVSSLQIFVFILLLNYLSFHRQFCVCKEFPDK